MSDFPWSDHNISAAAKAERDARHIVAVGFPVDAGHLGRCLASALFGECPAGGDHVWVTEWPEDAPGLTRAQRTHCDECGVTAPPLDPDDSPGL